MNNDGTQGYDVSFADNPGVKSLIQELERLKGDIEAYEISLNAERKENERLEGFIKNLQNIHFVELQGEKAENERLRKELQGIGVEQYYALQAKCREQAKELQRLHRTIRDQRRTIGGLKKRLARVEEERDRYERRMMDNHRQALANAVTIDELRERLARKGESAE